MYFSDEDNCAYVASNSLPGINQSVINDPNSSLDSNTGTSLGFKFNKEIKTKIKSSFINISNNIGGLEDVVDSDNQTFSTIKFNDTIDLETGDKIQYSTSGEPLFGIEPGIYFIKKDDLKIKLYASNAGIERDQFIPIGIGSGANSTHTFTLFSQKSGVIGPQKLFKKFPLSTNLENGSKVKTISGGTGMLINGVEISNYKSPDKIKFGPLESISILNSGQDYDVLNPPNITVSTGIGTTALVQPVISGKVTNIKIIPQKFDIEKIVSIGITGGNGSGCVLEPIIGERFREVTFNAFNSTIGSNQLLTRGGINTTSGDDMGKITFTSEHNFNDGESIIYDTNQNKNVRKFPVGGGSTILSNLSQYYPKIINSTTIKLFETPEDAAVGINTIKFESLTDGGVQIFKVIQKRALIDIKVIDGGKNYTNRNYL